MARTQSAGILAYRTTSGSLEVLLAHPGGPFFRNTDEGAWTIPRGLVEEGEDGLTAVVRQRSAFAVVPGLSRLRTGLT